MKIALLFGLVMMMNLSVFSQHKAISYLALGDSYTVGESVPLYENFPYQLVQQLRKKGVQVSAPEIVAKTGWTTDELTAGIAQTQFLPTYDFVTLLIGVNNQYRGRSIDEYAVQFETLLQKAITFAKNKPSKVIVVSIPDWGATPFAKDRDTKKIGTEIDAFNAVNKKIALQYKVHYADITPGSREALTDKDLVAKDGLHPSGKEYAKWADKIIVNVELGSRN
jgi:lysophospholipase L1-like esterase